MKRVIVWVLVVAAALYLIAVCLITPIIMHSILDNKVTYSQTWQAEQFELPSPEELHLTAEDGMDLVAYMVSPESPKAVVVCLTGIQNPSVTCYWGHAKMFYDAGYASILLEVRGHEPSGGERICVGYQESRDVRAVTDYIKSDERLTDVPVVVMGISMGASIAINSIGCNDDIDALVSISAYSSFEDALVELIKGNIIDIPTALTWVMKPVAQFTALIKYGVNPWKVCPKNAIKHLNGRPALLMHTREDKEVWCTNLERLMKNAPDGVQTCVRDVDEHFFISDFTAPRADTLYSDMLMDFIAKAVR